MHWFRNLLRRDSPRPEMQYAVYNHEGETLSLDGIKNWTLLIHKSDYEFLVLSVKDSQLEGVFVSKHLIPRLSFPKENVLVRAKYKKDVQNASN